MVFEISQSSWDYFVLRSIVLYLGLDIGYLLHEKRGISKVRIGNIQILKHILIPFLNLYPFPSTCYKFNQYTL
jgi:hypothetical protein